MIRRVMALAAVLSVWAAPAFSQEIITKWDFNSVPPDNNNATGTLVPAIGTGTASLSPNILEQEFRAGFPSGANDNSAWHVLPLSGAGTLTPTNPPISPAPNSRWIQFDVSTVGYQNITLEYDHRFSNTAANTALVQYTTNGTDWVTFDSYTVNIGDTWYYREFDLSAIPEVNNNPNFAIRIAPSIDPNTGDWGSARPFPASTVATTGTWRIDNLIFFGDVLGNPPVPTVTGPSIAVTDVGPVSWEVNFDQSVTGFDSADDIQLNTTGTATANFVSITGSGAGPYTVTVSSISGEGTVGITVKSGVATGPGGVNLASAPSDTVSVLPSSAPMATIGNPAAVWTTTGPVSFVVNFDLPVNGFDSADDIQVNATGTVSVGSVSITTPASAVFPYRGPYTVHLNDISGGGTVGITVKAGAATSAFPTANAQSVPSATVTVFDSSRRVVEWTFDSDPPNGSVELGTLFPSVGAGSVALAADMPTEFRAGFPNSGLDNNNSGLHTLPFTGVVGNPSNAASNPARLTKWVEFTADTTGYQNLTLAYYHRFSNTAPNTGTVQYTADGVNWVNIASYVAPDGDTWVSQVFNLSAIAAANNNPAFRFRVAVDVDPNTGEYASARPTSTLGTTGTWRFDYVTLLGDPLGAGPVVSIQDAKNLPDGSAVSLEGVALYLNQGGFGYVSSADRSGGIRLEGTITSSEGSLVNVSGLLGTTPGGERFLGVTGISTVGTMSLQSLGANNNAAASGLLDGLFVRVWGKVVPGSIGVDSYQITDGGNFPLTVKTPVFPWWLAEGDFVTVTGAAGYENARVIYQK